MRRRALSLMVATCVVAAATAACSGGDDEAQRHSGSPSSSIEVDGAVTGEVTARVRQDVPGPPVDVEGAEAITSVVEVATDGEVSGEVESRIPTPAVPTEEQIVFALAAETPEGPWELLPAQLEGGTVVVTTTHFSLFQAFKVLVGEVVDVARQTFDGLTSSVVAEAEPPTCEDEAGARMDGFNIGSDSTDTVYWCFGRDAEGRMVRMVNNRRYALLLSHRDGLVVTDQSSAGAVAWVSQLLTLDHQVAVAPRESVTFRVDLPAGGSASAVTEFDGLGGSISSFYVGVTTLLNFLTRFGAGSSRSIADIAKPLLTLPDCAAATANGNAGSMVAACFNDLDTLETAFGTGAAIVLSPLIVAGSLVSYLQSQLNAGFDQRNDRDRYRITISRREELPVLKDDQLGPLVIGMSLDSALATGWVGEEMVACEVSLGIATSDEARTFRLGGPSAPPGLDGNIDFFQGVIREIRVTRGALVGGVLHVDERRTPPDAADLLRAAGYRVEIGEAFEASEYLVATEADGDSLAVLYYDEGIWAGIPQVTTCD